MVRVRRPSIPQDTSRRAASRARIRQPVRRFIAGSDRNGQLNRRRIRIRKPARWFMVLLPVGWGDAPTLTLPLRGRGFFGVFGFGGVVRDLGFSPLSGWLGNLGFPPLSGWLGDFGVPHLAGGYGEFGVPPLSGWLWGFLFSAHGGLAGMLDRQDAQLVRRPSIPPIMRAAIRTTRMIRIRQPQRQFITTLLPLGWDLVVDLGG